MTDLPDTPLIIIGAGLSGLGTAIQLHRLQSFTTYEIYEKAASLGGTWWHNTYRIFPPVSPLHSVTGWCSWMWGGRTITFL